MDDDPAGSGYSSHTSLGSASLTVDRNATLTLGTDALIVLDEGLRHRRAATNCCGLLPRFGKTTQAIPFHHILWAKLSDFDVTINYVQPTGRKGKSCRLGYINYSLTDKSLHTDAKLWVDRLLAKAYRVGAKRQKRIKVLINPFGGQGNALKLWTREVEPILAAAHCMVDVEMTTHRGHAVAILEKLDIDAYDVVACASGDGLPHEAFNGLAKRKDARRALRKIAVCQIPCGSGNAMSLNFNGTNSPSLAALEIVKGIRSPLDLVAITQGDNLMYSFLSQTAGVIADTDLGTESLRWMGSFRFVWGIVVRMLGKTIYPAEVSVLQITDDKRVIREEYRRAREELDAANSKLLDREQDDDDAADDDQPLPCLKYGTVNDELPADFKTQDMSRLGIFYAGNGCYMMADAPFFPAALPADGKMDLILVPGDTKRMTCVRMLLGIEHGAMMNFPETSYSKIVAYRITPRASPLLTQRGLSARLRRWLGGSPADGDDGDGLISIDGERVPFEPFQGEVMPRMATVLSKNGPVYHVKMYTCGPP
jgi:sphingosine kinase